MLAKQDGISSRLEFSNSHGTRNRKLPNKLMGLVHENLQIIVDVE